jgi:hypothetical protein
MKKIAFAAIASAATLVLAACGSSDPASEGAQADNVEMPAEETMQNVDASAAPASDAAALPGADGTAPAADASAAATAPADPAAAKAAEDATKAAEKKM